MEVSLSLNYNCTEWETFRQNEFLESSTISRRNSVRDEPFSSRNHKTSPNLTCWCSFNRRKDDRFSGTKFPKQSQLFRLTSSRYYFFRPTFSSKYLVHLVFLQKGQTCTNITTTLTARHRNYVTEAFFMSPEASCGADQSLAWREISEWHFWKKKTKKKLGNVTRHRLNSGSLRQQAAELIPRTKLEQEKMKTQQKKTDLTEANSSLSQMKMHYTAHLAQWNVKCCYCSCHMKQMDFLCACWDTILSLCQYTSDKNLAVQRSSWAQWLRMCSCNGNFEVRLFFCCCFLWTHAEWTKLWVHFHTRDIWSNHCVLYSKIPGSLPAGMCCWLEPHFHNWLSSQKKYARKILMIAVMERDHANQLLLRATPNTGWVFSEKRTKIWSSNLWN